MGFDMYTLFYIEKYRTSVQRLSKCKMHLSVHVQWSTLVYHVHSQLPLILHQI